VSAARLPNPLPPAWLALPVFLSGAAALVYEVVWTRRLALVLGSTAGAVAAVLSAFMLGLALGAVLVGRRTDASRRPLRWYAFLEIGIGVSALAFESLVGLAAERLPSAAWLQAFLLLLIPSALMGGTLPVLARAAADAATRAAKALGLFYSLNTLGAVAGALLATFWLLPSFGLDGATYAAAATNLAVGVAAWAASRAAGDRALAPSEGVPPPPGIVRSAGVPVLVAFFLAGFSGLALQVAWTRLLVYLLEGFTVAFGVMLATYLLGLGAGAAAGTVLASTSRNPRRLLATLLLLDGLLAVLPLLFAGALSEPLEGMRRAQAELDSTGFTYVAGLFLAASAVMLPATLCQGALLPVVARIAISHPEAIGADSGGVYGASTFGAVLAPPLAAFVLVPALGVKGAIVVAAALLVLAGALCARGLGRAALVPVASGAGAFALVAFLAAPGEPTVKLSHVLRDPKQPRILHRFLEGANFGVSVVEDAGTRARALYTDDFRAAETGPKYGYMRMLAHLPMLMHEDPRRVLVVAFGTGTTAGAAAAHPEVKELVCVELERAVYDVAPEFAAANRDVLRKTSPQVRAVVADGREFVARAQDPFDVITLEPLMPYTPGAVHLYTREFYEAARARLRPDGFLCQWIPIHAVSLEDFRRLLKSATDVFPQTSLWYFEQSALVLAGNRTPPVVLDELTARIGRTPELFRDLGVALVGDAAHLLGAHVASGGVLVDALAGAEPLLDDRTDLEFRPLPRRFGRRSARFQAENLEFLASLAEASLAERGAIPWYREAESDGPVSVALRSGAATLRALAGEWRGMLSEGAPAASDELRPVLERDRDALLARSVFERRLYGELLAQGRFDQAAELALVPDRSAAFRMLAADGPPEQRRLHLALAVRQNALLLTPSELADGGKRAEAAAQLETLAASLPEAQKRFCTNRARLLRGQPVEAGEEELPEMKVPDLRPLLETGDAAGAREALHAARLMGASDEVEAQAKAFLDAAADKRVAALLLDAAESVHALRAGLSLQLSRREEDRVAAAQILCTRSLVAWEKLCQDSAPEVRDAAASAAAERGDARHLPRLASLCGDAQASVRMAAFTAFLRLVPQAQEVGYDPQAPSESALAELRRLAGS